jgi:hypothetical protein
MFPVRYELNLCYVEESRPPLWSSGEESLATERRSIVFPVRYELNLCMLCRRKYTTEELLERKSSGSGLKVDDMAVGIRHADPVAPSIL